MNNNPDPHILIGKYVSGSLSKSEAEDLSRMIEKKPEIAEQIRSNFFTDFLLNRKFTIDREEHNAFDSPFDQNRSNFEDLIPWEKEESEPIRISPPEEPPKRNLLIRILHKWSEYDREKRNQTTRSAPTVYGKKTNFFFLIWLIAFISFITWLSLNGSNKKEKNYVPVFVSLGQIQNLVDVEWPENSIPYKNGQHLGSGRFSLNKGIMQVQLANGAEVYLEGPGEYLFINQDSCYCDQGKISAHVPPSAKGFQIASPFGTFIDRGTEFYLVVNKKQAQMGVVKGKVDFVFEKNDPHPLIQGEEIQLKEDQPLAKTASDPKQFMNQDRFLPVLMDFTARQKKIKEEKEILWNTNPNLLVHFDLDREGSSPVLNTAAHGKDQIPQGNLIGTASAEGSLFGTKSIRFPAGASIRTAVPGKYRSLTLMASIKIGQLPNMANVLFCGENLDSQPGIFLWQIAQDNFLQLQISSKNSKIHQLFDSPICFSRKNWGTWVNVAVVIDAESKTVSHYLDGERIASVPWNSPSDLSIGNATIGNAVRRTMKNEYHLGCPMKNFMIFDKALSESEIKQYIVP
ncbi:MAG: LamG-like jellyroll fold domain-containing protein [Planctomycetia bacterium]|nr:LamG-like jellyroll fold domain-containing protein [Planctomycetia bacterium]